MEYLVNIRKRRAFWSLNKDILKIYYFDYQYAVSIKEDTAYPCLHSPKTTKERRSIHRIQKKSIRRIEDIVCEYSGRYQTWSLLQETPICRIQSLGYAASSGYGVLVFVPSWSFVKCKHRYAISSLMDTAYRMSEVFAGDIYGDHALSCASIVVDIGLSDGRDKTLRPVAMLLYLWDRGLDVCVDLIGSSPLTQTGMADFVPSRVMIDAAKPKCIKYENNELLMKNHQSRPTGSLAYPEVNATKNDPKSFMRGQGQSHGKGRVQFGKKNSHGHNRSLHRNRKMIEFILTVADSPVFLINNAIFSPKSSRNLLSFGDIYLNGYDTQTTTIENEKYLHIIDKSNVLEKLPMLHSGLHYTYLSMEESHMVIKEKSCDPGIVSMWHDRLGHPGSTLMKRIIESTHGHPLKDQKILQMDKMAPCSSCSLGKLIARPSPLKVEKESLMFLERIQGDICGPIHPPCRPFRYFMVLIDASSRWSHVSLLLTRNVAFVNFLAQIIKLRAHFLDYTVKRVRIDNAGEFTSQSFNDYSRPLIMRTNLPVSIWGHAILHNASLIHMRPSENHVYSPMQLAFGQEPNISHLRIFGCAIYVPIAPPQQTKMGPQRRLGIYVGYETISIIRYLEPLTGDVFTSRLLIAILMRQFSPRLGKKNKNHEKDVSWSEPSLLYLDPRTKQSETEVQKIMHMQEIANQLPDAFTNTKRVTKSYIPAVNAPARVEIPDVKSDDKVTQESKARLKRGRPVEEEIDDINKVVSINYGHSKISFDQIEIEIIDDKFCYNVACDIMNGNDDPEPTSVIECQSRHDWNKWKEAMQAELNSLNKRKVFGRIVLTPEVVKPVGYRWVFIRKRNENDEVIRYKARLVAQGFSQRPGIDYEETYSPVMDAITFRYLISLTISENLDMRLIDVVIAYLYGSLDSAIYMKIPEGNKMPEALSAKPKDMYSVKLQRSLYGLKQSGRMWYNRLSDYLVSKGYKSNLICPCVFIKKTTSGFVIIVVYVDDLNIIGTNKEINEVFMHLKEEF
ncbi:disease resistance CC-NBS-LRR class family protein [Tanacetum coccineum]